MKHFIGVLAYGLTDAGHKLDQGSKERCYKALELYHELIKQKEKVEILAAAGFADRKRYPKQDYTMAEVIAAFVESDLLHRANYRNVEVLNKTDLPRIWGTEAEVRAFYAYAHASKDAFVVHIVTHWWHVPRLRYLLWKLDLRARVHGARGTNVGTLYELYKFPGQILRDIFRSKHKKTPRSSS